MRHDEPMVRGYAVTHPAGVVRLPTQPGWDQVLYAKVGLFTARTGDDTWFVPAHRALCAADGERLQVETARPAVLRCLYLRAELGAVPAGVRVVDVGPLTRELLLHAVESAPIDVATPAGAAIVTLVADRLGIEPAAALRLPLPVDGRARRLAEAVLGDPSAPLGSLIAGSGASRRTLERRFPAETGLTVAAWQRRARVLAAISMLTDGVSVTQTAAAVGYATPSSFVAAFRSELGTTPRRFLGG